MKAGKWIRRCGGLFLAAALAVLPVGSSTILANETDEVKVTAYSETVAGEISAGEKVIVNIEEAGEWKYYSFTPDEDAWYIFSSTGFVQTGTCLYDADWNVLVNENDLEDNGLEPAYSEEVTYYCLAGETYYVGYCLDSNYTGKFIGAADLDDSADWMDTDALTVLSDEAAAISGSGTSYFCFTPSETDYYMLVLSGIEDVGNVQVYIYDSSYESERSVYSDLYFYIDDGDSESVFLEAGETYYFEFIAYGSEEDSLMISLYQGDSSYDWMDDGDQLPKLSKGNTKLATGNCAYYKYTAPKSTYYRFSVSTKNVYTSVHIYASNKKPVYSAYIYKGQSCSVWLEAGETYYIQLDCDESKKASYTLKLEINDGSGSCGKTSSDKVKWSIKNNTLTISGSGAMADYGCGEDEPWYVWGDSYEYVVIKSGVTAIGEEAFSYNTNIVSARIASSVKQIGDGAFSDCNSLQKVVLKKGLRIIESSAFRYCTSLKRISIPASVTQIGKYAFDYDKNLNTVVFKGDAPSIRAGAFCDDTVTVRYPAGNSTWTSDVMKKYGGKITWKSYQPDKKQKLKVRKASLKHTFTQGRLEKKAGTFYLKASSSGTGTLNYTKVKGDSCIKVSKSGKVTVKKGTKAGTYTVKVKIRAESNYTYKSTSVIKTVRVKVKN